RVFPTRRSSDLGCRSDGERDDALRTSGVAIRAWARGDHGSDHFEPENARGAAGENRNRSGGGARGADRFDTDEGRDGAKNGTQHAEYRDDGAAWTCL